MHNLVRYNYYPDIYCDQSNHSWCNTFYHAGFFVIGKPRYDIVVIIGLIATALFDLVPGEEAFRAAVLILTQLAKKGCSSISGTLHIF